VAAVERVPLLEGRREWGIFLGVAALLLLLHLGWLYREYRSFVALPFYYAWGEVLKESPRRNARGPYRLLTVRTDEGWTIRTRSYRREGLRGRRIRLQLFPSERVSFLDYLRGPYLPSRIREVEPPGDSSLRERLGAFIAAQHRDPEAAAFYRSIFLADPLPPSLRERIAALGASHLVALSGFHLGILWGGIFLLLRPLYRFFQRRYFPWRHDLRDLGSFALAVLGGYLWLTGAPPSLIRAYAMLFLGWLALLWGLEIVGVPFLVVVGTLLVVLFPDLLLSWSFGLSLAGVFSIFLILRHWESLPSWLLSLFAIPLGIYLLMLPVSHTLFPAVNPWQNLSPLLSLLFVPFYPLAILLHFFGMGGLLDPWLFTLWSLPEGATVSRSLPEWVLPLYTALALGAVRYRRLFRALFLIGLGTGYWLYC
jgi:competence protein ComEC